MIRTKARIDLEPVVVHELGFYPALVLQVLYAHAFTQNPDEDGCNAPIGHYLQLLYPRATAAQTDVALALLAEHGYIDLETDSQTGKVSKWRLTDRAAALAGVVDVPAPKDYYAETPEPEADGMLFTKKPKKVKAQPKPSILTQEPVRTAWELFKKWGRRDLPPLLPESEAAYARVFAKHHPDDVAWCLMYAIVNRQALNFTDYVSTNEKARYRHRFQCGSAEDTFDVMVTEAELDAREEREVADSSWKAK